MMQFSTRIAASLLFASALSGHALAQSAGPSFALATASTEVVRSPDTGLVKWLSGADGQPVAEASTGAAGIGVEQAARAFLEGQSSAFGLDNSESELTTTRVIGDNIGRNFVRFQQTYKGVPIIAAELNVQMDAQRNVRSVSANSVGDLSLSVEPSISTANAKMTAVRSTAVAHQVSMPSLTGSAPTLAIHDARLMGGPAAPPRLVWRVEVTSATHLHIRELVLVDAQSGRVAVQFNQTDAAAPDDATQRICDAHNTSTRFPCKAGQAIPDPEGSSIVDVQNAFKFTENTFDFYARRFDRNSLDDAGLVLITTTRYCDPSFPCPYENAFWNGKQMVYGDTYASADDVVGHELSHGFTEFTSDLIYQNQSGAMNESLSDIFGELMDQTNGFDAPGGSGKWLVGEDLPINEIRNMKNPPAFSDPDRMQSPLYYDGPKDRGGVHTNSGVGNKTAYLITEPGTRTFNGQTVSGIGVDKSAAIWFRVDGFLLTSGSQYADLGIALKQACKDLVGTTPNDQAGNPSPSGVFTKANCKEVTKAVLATELAKPPLVRVSAN